MRAPASSGTTIRQPGTGSMARLIGSCMIVSSVRAARDFMAYSWATQRQRRIRRYFSHGEVCRCCAVRQSVIFSTDFR